MNLTKKLLSLLLIAIVAIAISQTKASAALSVGYHDLGGGQGVIVMTHQSADSFANDVMIGSSSAMVAILSPIMSWTKASVITWLCVYFISMNTTFRIHWCATQYGAPYVYIYTIWNGIAVWADPAW